MRRLTEKVESKSEQRGDRIRNKERTTGKQTQNAVVIMVIVIHDSDRENGGDDDRD